MIILRIFLYLICTLSLGWSVIVYAGPMALAWFVETQTNGRVKVSNIKISPTLDVEAGLIEFLIYNEKLDPILGKTRSAAMNWSVFNVRPFLSINLGPTSIGDMVNFDGIDIQTLPINMIDFQKLPLTVTAYNLASPLYGEARKLVFDGIFVRPEQELRNLNFFASKISTATPLPATAESMTGKLSNIYLKQDISEQTIYGDASLKNMSSQIFQLKASVSDIFFKSSDNGLNFSLTINDSILDEINGLVGGLIIEGNYSDRKLVNLTNIEIESGTFLNEKIKFSKIFTEIETLDPEIYRLESLGEIENAEIHLNQKYVGNLPKSKFKVMLTFDASSKELVSGSTIEISDARDTEIFGSLDILAGLESLETKTKCFITNCALSNINLEYEITLDNEKVKGKSVCNEKPCVFDNLSHVITTSNSAKIFETLSRSKMINPIALAYLYGFVTSGKVIESGHEINL